MGSYWKKLAWIWVWRHVRLGLAPRRLGVGAAPAWVWRDHANSQRIRICAITKETMHNTETFHANNRREPNS